MYAGSWRWECASHPHHTLAYGAHHGYVPCVSISYTHIFICPLCRLTIYLYTHTTIRRCVHGKELHNTQCNKPGYQKRSWRPCVVIARVPCDSCLVLVGLAELDVRHVHRHAHHCMQQHMCPTVRLPEHVCFLMAPMACSTRCR